MAEENEKKAIGAPEASTAEEPLIDETKVSPVRGGVESFVKPSTRRGGNTKLRIGANWGAIEAVRSFCSQGLPLRCCSCSSGVFLLEHGEEINGREASGNAGLGTQGDARPAGDCANGIGDTSAERTNRATRGPWEPRRYS